MGYWTVISGSRFRVCVHNKEKAQPPDPCGFYMEQF